MTTIKATVRNGKLEVDEPLDLPDGLVLKIDVNTSIDDEYPLPPEMLAAQLRAFEEFAKLPKMSDEDYAAWEAERLARRESEKAHFFEHAEKLGKGWE